MTACRVVNSHVDPSQGQRDWTWKLDSNSLCLQSWHPCDKQQGGTAQDFCRDHRHSAILQIVQKDCAHFQVCYNRRGEWLKETEILFSGHCLCLCLCLGLLSVSRPLSLSVSLYLSFLFQKVQFTFYSFQDTVSVQEPGFYAKRFKEFMSTKVFKKNSSR